MPKPVVRLSPSRSLTFIDCLAAAVDDTLQFAVDLKAFGTVVMARATRLIASGVTAVSPRRASPMGCAETGPVAFKPVGLVRPIACSGLEFLFKIGQVFIDDGLGLFGGQHTFTDSFSP